MSNITSQEEIQETLSWIRSFLKERLNSEHQSIRDAAKQALFKLKQFERTGIDPTLSPEVIKDHILGTDSSIYFTPRREPTKLDSEIDELDRQLRSVGILDEDGKIRRYMWEDDLAPTRLNVNGRIIPYETKTVPKYIDDTHKTRPYDPMTNFRNVSTNNNDQNYYKYEVNGNDPSKFKKGNWTVRGEFKGYPDFYDSQFNTRHAESIGNGTREGRHDGARNFTILFNDTEDPQKRGFYLFKQDMIPEGAVDGFNQDFFPYEGQTKLKKNYTAKDLENINKEIQNKSPYGVESTNESNHRRSRLQKLEVDEAGHLTQNAIDGINALTVGNNDDGIDNNNGIHYDYITYVDPATGGVKRRRRVFYARGGRLPKAPTRDKYGNKIARADNLSTRDYDVYF